MTVERDIRGEATAYFAKEQLPNMRSIKPIETKYSLPFDASKERDLGFTLGLSVQLVCLCDDGLKIVHDGNER